MVNGRFFTVSVLPYLLTQPFPFDIDPQPRPVVGSISEALGLRCEVLGLVGWNASFVDVDGHPFLESFNLRDKGWVCYSVGALETSTNGFRDIICSRSRVMSFDGTRYE